MNMFILLQAAVADSIAGVGVAMEQVASMSYLELAVKGGWVMIPIIICSIMATYVFFDRFFAIKRATRMDPNFMNRIREYVYEKKFDSAIALCQSNNTPLARMIEKGIQRIGRPLKNVEESIEIVGKFEIYNLERNLVILGIIAGIAPMMGFIGTIMGVIKIFYNISLADNISIGLIADGLYEKMITSASGLLVGIVAFIAYHWLNIMMNKTVHKLEYNTMNFLDLLQEPAK